MTTTNKLLGLIAASLFSLGANAGIIFQDNFDTEAGAPNNSITKYNAFTNWTVSDGTVDLVANSNPWGLKCAGNTGKCVDLDGSNGNAGKLSSNLFALAAGDYTLSFDISGNQRGGASDSMLLSLGGFLNENFTLSPTTPWMTITRNFSVTSAGTNNIVFNHAGGDNIGLMLDNVVLTKITSSVSEPTPLLLLGLGLLGLGAARRKARH